MNVTIIDLGSNTFQLLQARRTEAGRVDPLYADVEFVELARHVGPDGMITSLGSSLGIQAVERLVAHAPASAAAGPVVAVATCAIRDARNGADFLASVAASTGLEARILDGREEAGLTYAGAVTELSDVTGPVAVVDLGGGATQIAWGSGPNSQSQISVRLGVLALAERLSGLSNVGNVALDHMAAFVLRTIEPAVLQTQPFEAKTLVFASGAARVILALMYSYGVVSKGMTVPTLALADLVPKLLEAAPEELLRRGVPAKRINSVGPTAVVLAVIAQLFELDRFVVVKSGLREGLALQAERVGLQPWPRLRP